MTATFRTMMSQLGEMRDKSKIREAARQATAKEVSVTETAGAVLQIPQQLPLWSENLRGLPNALARSALFTCANQRAPRAFVRNERVVTVAGYSISYTGEELRQDDEDVFLQIVHLARMQPLGNVIEISGNGLLTALDWGNSKRYYTRVREIIERLQQGSVEIVQAVGDADGFKGQLIRKIHWKAAGQERSGPRTKWRIYLEPEIIALFGDDTYTLLDWGVRKRLGPLSKWLHSFYHSHRDPYPYKIDTLRSLSGSKATHLSSFRRDVRKALEELVVVGFARECTYDPKTDTALVVRNRQRPSLTTK